MKKQPNFKKGDWLIRKWKRNQGGETDLCKFDSIVASTPIFSGECIRYTLFYRFNRKNELLRQYSSSYTVESTPSKDKRLSQQWRKATASEIKAYAMLLFNTPPLPRAA